MRRIFTCSKILQKIICKIAIQPRTRSVAAQFAHIHNVRLRWLNHAAPKLVVDLQSFPKGAQPTKEELKQALQASQPIVARFLEECESSGKVKSWNGSPATFLSYMVAHEAHHRALAISGVTDLWTQTAVGGYIRTMGLG